MSGDPMSGGEVTPDPTATAVVKLRNPDREVEVTAPRQVRQLLMEVGLHPDAVLVIRDGALLTREDVVRPGDLVEVRPVISGGAA
ncbi:MAG TPA: MoaD/ThiS family protein [Mycobacteriales bacterium]|nr:MoaD/ThiS family protein [Mycobacteriales bacterium]